MDATIWQAAREYLSGLRKSFSDLKVTFEELRTLKGKTGSGLNGTWGRKKGVKLRGRLERAPFARAIARYWEIWHDWAIAKFVA